jgi:hypothetical protein
LIGPEGWVQNKVAYHAHFGDDKEIKEVSVYS